MSQTRPGRLLSRLGGADAVVRAACGFILGCPNGRNDGAIQLEQTVARADDCYQPRWNIHGEASQSSL